MQNAEDNSASKARPRKSKAAIASFVLAVLSVPFFIITALPAIIFGIVALVKIKGCKGQLTGKRLAIAGISMPVAILACFAALFALWEMDAPPIENDWRVADMRSAAPEYSDSYDLLLSLADVDYLKSPISSDLDSTPIDRIKEISSSIPGSEVSSLNSISAKAQEHATEIESIWTSSIEARKIIKKLATYEKIADIAEQKYEPEKTFFTVYKQMAKLYWLHATVMCEQGNTTEGAKTIVEFDSVSRKQIINSCTIISNLVVHSAIFQNIRIANYIINHPESTTESIELLTEHFKPLTEDHASLRNAVISEYLTFKNALEANSFKYWYGDTDYSVSEAKEERRLKNNSTLRLFRNTLENLYQIDQGSKPLSLWPFGLRGWGRSSMDFKDWDFRPMSDLYMEYNPDGTILTSIYMPALWTIKKLKTKLLVYDDLFQIALAMRLGREYDLTARAYGGEYIVDVDKEIIFSAGPDEEAYTDDDISLPINPAVLGLVETETKIYKEQI